MISAGTLLIILALSILIVHIGSVALVMTGLSKDIANFQALSAFSGVGFTTSESENIIGTPARRKIISLLIRLGSVGVVTAISSLIISFVNPSGSVGVKFLFLVVGLLVLVMISRSSKFDQFITPIIEKFLSQYSELQLHDFPHLLHLYDSDYRVSEVKVQPESNLAESPLEELHLYNQGVLVLGIANEKEYNGAPHLKTKIKTGDTVILYGRLEKIKKLVQVI